MRIFLAGATGVIGKPLTRLLIDAGHQVTGTTRSAGRAEDIRALGAQAAVVDAFDLEALKAAAVAAKPDVVIHQFTDLPDKIEADKMPAALAANARLRIEGTYNLIVAAKSAGVRRVIAQSIAFMYAPGKPLYRETDPLVPAADGPGGISARGVHALEGAVLGTPGIEGIVLRYGRLYGPGTWADKPDGSGFVHTDAAAQAALLAVTRGAPGIYNIAEDDGAVDMSKARHDLGFDPAFRVRMA